MAELRGLPFIIVTASLTAGGAMVTTTGCIDSKDSNAGWDDSANPWDSETSSDNNSGWYDSANPWDTQGSETTGEDSGNDTADTADTDDTGDTRPVDTSTPDDTDDVDTGNAGWYDSADTDDRDTGNAGWYDSGDTGGDVEGELSPSPAGLDWDRLGWCAPEAPESDLRRYRGAESPWMIIDSDP